jgi:hypothetical protein
MERLTEIQRATIARLEKRLDASKDQLLAFFRIIDDAGVPAENIPARLIEIARRYRALLTQFSSDRTDDREMTQLMAEAHAALDMSDLARSDALLSRVELAHAAADAAAASGERCEIAMIRLHYQEAADRRRGSCALARHASGAAPGLLGAASGSPLQARGRVRR